MKMNIKKMDRRMQLIPQSQLYVGIIPYFQKTQQRLLVICFLSKPYDIDIELSYDWEEIFVWRYMTGLLHEGKFNVRDLLEPAIFDSLPWAYVMCNWAQILIGDRH